MSELKKYDVISSDNEHWHITKDNDIRNAHWVAARLNTLTDDVAQLEEHLKQTKAAFIDSNKQAYDEGLAQGQSYQAICEIRGRERFTDSLHTFMESHNLDKEFKEFLTN